MSKQPEVVTETAMREAFKRLPKKTPTIQKAIKRNAGRVFHRKGWFVTRERKHP